MYDLSAGSSNKGKDMETRNEALERILDIARQHDLQATDITQAFKLADGTGTEPAANLLGRILGYLGGIFIFAGLCIFIALNWDAMNTAGRIIITLGSGIAIFIMAIVATGDERYSRVKVPLFLVAAALQPLGIMVAIDEFSSGGDWHLAVLLTTGIMFFQQAAVFWQKRETTKISRG